MCKVTKSKYSFKLMYNILDIHLKVTHAQYDTYFYINKAIIGMS